MNVLVMNLHSNHVIVKRTTFAFCGQKICANVFYSTDVKVSLSPNFIRV